MLTFANKEWLEPRGANDGPVSDFKGKKNKQFIQAQLYLIINERKVNSWTKTDDVYYVQVVHGSFSFSLLNMSQSLMGQFWQASLNGLVLLVGVVFLTKGEEREQSSISYVCWEIMSSQ